MSARTNVPELRIAGSPLQRSKPEQPRQDIICTGEHDDDQHTGGCDQDQAATVGEQTSQGNAHCEHNRHCPAGVDTQAASSRVTPVIKAETEINTARSNRPRRSRITPQILQTITKSGAASPNARRTAVPAV